MARSYVSGILAREGVPRGEIYTWVGGLLHEAVAEGSRHRHAAHAAALKAISSTHAHHALPTPRPRARSGKSKPGKGGKGKGGKGKGGKGKGKSKTEPAPAAAPPASAPSNAGYRALGLRFRTVGATGEPYPPWVRDLDGHSGVYILRVREPDGTTPIVYVGESHTGRLRQTLTRHFQAWRRAKKFWTGYTGSLEHDPGLTYERGNVTAAVVVGPASHAAAAEAHWIAKLRPRDNLLGQPPELDAIPF